MLALYIIYLRAYFERGFSGSSAGVVCLFYYSASTRQAKPCTWQQNELGFILFHNKSVSIHLPGTVNLSYHMIIALHINAIVSDSLFTW